MLISALDGDGALEASLESKNAGIFLFSCLAAAASPTTNSILCFILAGCPLGSTQPQGTFVIRRPIRSAHHLAEPVLHRRVWTPRGLSRTLEGTQAKRKKSQSQGRYC